MATFDEVYIGQNVVIETGTITNASGSATTPATLTLRIRKPSGAILTYSLSDMTAITTGEYKLEYVPDESGRHYVEISTTTPSTAGAASFDVATSVMAI